MPHGQLKIYNWDGTGTTYDAFDTWGVSLSDGAISTLLAPPAAKDRVSNESRLEDGRRIDTEAQTRFQAREMTLEMHLIASTYEQFLSRRRAFLQALTASGRGVRIMFVYDGQQTQFDVRYLSFTQFAVYGGTLGKFAVRFIEPKPNNGLPPATLNLDFDNEE